MNRTIAYGTYTRVFLALSALVCVPAGVSGLLLEPLRGDLTRLGFFPESEFGWNQTEHRFSPPLAQEGSAEEAYDLVVLGDSFSITRKFSQNAPGSLWTNSLAQRTGLRVGVFRIESPAIHGIIRVLTERQDAPIAIIYQTAERELANRLGGEQSCPATVYDAREAPEFNLDPIPVEAVPYSRDTGVEVGDLGYSLKYMLANLTGRRFTHRVTEVRLTRDDLFSNAAPERMLFFTDDLNKSSWTEETWRNVRCNALTVQNEVQANGRTRFVLLVIPDKSSVYEPFFADGRPALSQLDRLETGGLNLLRVDQALREAVAEGAVDVYLPNDTHLSSRGHALVADVVVRSMTTEAHLRRARESVDAP